MDRSAIDVGSSHLIVCEGTVLQIQTGSSTKVNACANFLLSLAGNVDAALNDGAGTIVDNSAVKERAVGKGDPRPLDAFINLHGSRGGGFSAERDDIPLRGLPFLSLNQYSNQTVSVDRAVVCNRAVAAAHKKADAGFNVDRAVVGDDGPGGSRRSRGPRRSTFHAGSGLDVDDALIDDGIGNILTSRRASNRHAVGFEHIDCAVVDSRAAGISHHALDLPGVGNVFRRKVEVNRAAVGKLMAVARGEQPIGTGLIACNGHLQNIAFGKRATGLFRGRGQIAAVAGALLIGKFLSQNRAACKRCGNGCSQNELRSFLLD